MIPSVQVGGVMSLTLEQQMWAQDVVGLGMLALNAMMSAVLLWRCFPKLRRMWLPLTAKMGSCLALCKRLVCSRPPCDSCDQQCVHLVFMQCASCFNRLQGLRRGRSYFRHTHNFRGSLQEALLPEALTQSQLSDGAYQQMTAQESPHSNNSSLQ